MGAVLNARMFNRRDNMRRTQDRHRSQRLQRRQYRCLGATPFAISDFDCKSNEMKRNIATNIQQKQSGGVAEKEKFPASLTQITYVRASPIETAPALPI